MNTIQTLLTDHLYIWTAAETEKNQAMVIVPVMLSVAMT